MKIKVTDGDGGFVGEIWSEGDSTIKSTPPRLITMTRRFLESNPDLDAPGIVQSMDGWSNGYLVCTLAS